MTVFNELQTHFAVFHFIFSILLLMTNALNVFVLWFI